MTPINRKKNLIQFLIQIPHSVLLQFVPFVFNSSCLVRAPFFCLILISFFKQSLSFIQSDKAIGDWEGRVYLCWCKLAFVASQAVLRSSSLCLLMVGALLVGQLFVIVYLALCQISWFIFKVGT
ncbi:Hypothetical_protein [Hexamita inflata]|uniref:Hypothetical_protein n=1 Tax=Hexamita inflata TaxID=28002 RepID=A0AA86Q5N4_9EUKA|nr:Hypothetical protein HINF_LOCUS34180 [Hexamita inflata]CAI9946545.1 Hypothetical protein HINF_LOCUS34190 [Hexamita inflata]CAI9946550.1 Hypothetical protein HINF_LOCUS34195 [Hexamita inflata]